MFSILKNKFHKQAANNTSNHTQIITLKNLCLPAILLILSSISISLSSNITNNKISFFKPVIDSLIERGADSSFVHNLISNEQIEFNEKFVKINVSSSLKKTKPDYSKHYNARAVNKTKIFIEEYKNTLQRAEAMYQVPKEVIASILWVETRHGGYTGKNNVVSVFLSTAMASQEEYVNLNISVIEKEYQNNPKKIKELTKKVIQRAKKKSQWALNELLALEKIAIISPIEITELKGSWAGAFGLSQFLPSSYMSWAVDGNYDGKINLFDKTDAIFSVGNYLKTNGWGKELKKQRKAVYHYNHSQDYVDAVLKLADLVKI